jgi:flagellar biosynthesis protein FliR
MTLAFVSRASPQLQIFNVGVAVSLGGGLLVMMASLDDIAAGIAGELGAIGPRIESLLGAIAR